mgnify:CR=1
MSEKEWSAEVRKYFLEQERMKFFIDLCVQAGWDHLHVTRNMVLIISAKSKWKRLTKEINLLS